MPLLFISRKEDNSVPSAASTVWTVTRPEPWFLPKMPSVPRFSLHRCVTEKSGALTWLWSAVLLHRPEPSQLPSVVSRIPWSSVRSIRSMAKLRSHIMSGSPSEMITPSWKSIWKQGVLTRSGYIWDTSDTRSLRIICIVRYMIILNVSPFILTS